MLFLLICITVITCHNFPKDPMAMGIKDLLLQGLNSDPKYIDLSCRYDEQGSDMMRNVQTWKIITITKRKRI